MKVDLSLGFLAIKALESVGWIWWFFHTKSLSFCVVFLLFLCFFRQWRHYITTYAELIWLSADFPDGLTFVYDQVNLFYYFNQHGFGIRSKHGKYNQTRICHLTFYRLVGSFFFTQSLHYFQPRDLISFC